MLHHVSDQRVLQLEMFAAHIAAERLGVGVMDTHMIPQALPIQCRVAARRATVPNHRVLYHVLAQTNPIFQPFVAFVALDAPHFGLMCGQVIGQVAAARKLLRTNVANEILAVQHVGHISMGCQSASRCEANERMRSPHIRLRLFTYATFRVAMFLPFSAFITNVRDTLVLGQMRYGMCDERAAVAKATRAQRTGERSLRLWQMVLDVILQNFRTSEQFVALRTLECVRLQMTGHVQCHCPWLDQFDAATGHMALQCVMANVMFAQIGEPLELCALPGISILRQTH